MTNDEPLRISRGRRWGDSWSSSILAGKAVTGQSLLSTKGLIKSGDNCVDTEQVIQCAHVPPSLACFELTESAYTLHRPIPRPQRPSPAAFVQFSAATSEYQVTLSAYSVDGSTYIVSLTTMLAPGSHISTDTAGTIREL